MKELYQNAYLKEQTPNENKIIKVFNTKTIKQLTRKNMKTKNKELQKELANKMTNPYYFIDGKLKKSFKNNLDSHNTYHANSISSIIPLYPYFGTEIRCF